MQAVLLPDRDTWIAAMRRVAAGGSWAKDVRSCKIARSTPSLRVKGNPGFVDECPRGIGNASWSELTGSDSARKRRRAVEVVECCADTVALAGFGIDIEIEERKRRRIGDRGDRRQRRPDRLRNGLIEDEICFRPRNGFPGGCEILGNGSREAMACLHSHLHTASKLATPIA